MNSDKGYLYHFYDVTRNPRVDGFLMGNKKSQCLDYWQKSFSNGVDEFRKFLWEYFPEVR